MLRPGVGVAVVDVLLTHCPSEAFAAQAREGDATADAGALVPAWVRLTARASRWG